MRWAFELISSRNDSEPFMSHKPPVPDAATSPYPLHPAPIEHVEPVDEQTGDTDEAPAAKMSNRTLGIAAAGAAIGSAAVAAALIFYNRPATPAKRAAPPKPKAKRAAKPKTTTAKPASVKTATVKTAQKPRAGARAKPKPKPKSNTPA
jgi:hypothetical protein